VPAAFRFAMRRLATTVTVVTALNKGARVGMTASAITSRTINPPALLVCINQSASIHTCLEVGRPFCGQLTGVGAARDSRGVRRPVLPVRRASHMASGRPMITGVPRLEGAQANVSCLVDRMLAYGTHSIVIGRVEAVRIAGTVDPLIFQDGTTLSEWTLSVSAMTDIHPRVMRANPTLVNFGSPPLVSGRFIFEDRMRTREEQPKGLRMCPRVG